MISNLILQLITSWNIVYYKNDSLQICSANKQEQKESMSDIENKLIEISCYIDDFNQVFINELRTSQLSDGSRKRIRPASLDETLVLKKGLLLVAFLS